jgi:hypothetical protein
MCPVQIIPSLSGNRPSLQPWSLIYDTCPPHYHPSKSIPTPNTFKWALQHINAAWSCTLPPLWSLLRPLQPPGTYLLGIPPTLMNYSSKVSACCFVLSHTCFHAKSSSLQIHYRFEKAGAHSALYTFPHCIRYRDTQMPVQWGLNFTHFESAF